MLTTPTLAQRFMATYADFLLALLPPESAQAKKNRSQLLVQARTRYFKRPAALDEYRKLHPQADADMLDAIAALKIQRWVYLKDTKAYSIWLDEACQQAYAVLGLTQRLRDISQGASGVLMTAGLMPLGGRWVADGLMEGMAWLGPNYRRDYTAIYHELKRSGRFSLGPA